MSEKPIPKKENPRAKWTKLSDTIKRDGVYVAVITGDNVWKLDKEVDVESIFSIMASDDANRGNNGHDGNRGHNSDTSVFASDEIDVKTPSK